MLIVEDGLLMSTSEEPLLEVHLLRTTAEMVFITCTNYRRLSAKVNTRICDSNRRSFVKENTKNVVQNIHAVCGRLSAKDNIRTCAVYRKPCCGHIN